MLLPLTEHPLPQNPPGRLIMTGRLCGKPFRFV